MALLSDAAAFYTWTATTWVFTASVVVAIVRCWAAGRGLRAEDVFTGFRAPLVLVAALLSQVSLRLYTVRVRIPGRQRGGGQATGVNAALERFLSDEAYVWPVGVCMFGLLAALISRVYEARRRAPPPPPPPPPPPSPSLRRRRRQRRAEAGQSQRTGGCCSVSAIELVLFLFCVWTCVYSFPVMVLGYMAATANGSGSMAG